MEHAITHPEYDTGNLVKANFTLVMLTSDFVYAYILCGYFISFRQSHLSKCNLEVMKKYFAILLTIVFYM